jgi:hypothetical protein
MGRALCGRASLAIPRAAVQTAVRAAVLGAVFGAFVAGCAPKAVPPCCATLGYNRTEVETVLGTPTPPQPSKYHPAAPLPAGAEIYTTEHGYLTVTYFGMTPAVAQHFTLDFFEGKNPGTGFAMADAYLPDDAQDTGAHATGTKFQIRLYTSRQVERTLPASGGRVFVECAGPNPTRECDRMEIGAGNP